MIKHILFLIISFFPIVAYCDSVKAITEFPLHDGLVTREFGNEILQATQHEPPAPIKEIIPTKQPLGTIWIDGYWDWSFKREDFIWVSGFWRRPPPGRVWVAPRWVPVDAGWIRLHGFWSGENEGDVTYFQQPPPDLLDEQVPSPPGQDFFWVPGGWKYDSTNQDYVWYHGNWQPFNLQWQYVPPHYEWQEKGYLYVPSFWDWPIEARGMAYANAVIDQKRDHTVVYYPSKFIDPLLVAELLFPHWPDYVCFFQDHFHRHEAKWKGWKNTPPWWNWQMWWCFSGQEGWWLWWWWTTPGYPIPPFLPTDVLQNLPPPSTGLIDLMQGVMPPAVVTEGGVVGSKTLIQAIEQINGEERAILPSDPRLVKQIQQVAKPQVIGSSSVRPRGKSPFEGKPYQPWKNSKQANALIMKLPPKPEVKATKRAKVKHQSGVPPTYRNPPKRYPITEEELREAEAQSGGEGRFLKPDPIRTYRQGD